MQGYYRKRQKNKLFRLSEITAEYEVSLLTPHVMYFKMHFDCTSVSGNILHELKLSTKPVAVHMTLV